MVNLTIAIILGFVAGWLVNYLSDVLPIQHKFARPTCSQCGATFSWRNYFLVRACQECKHARGPRTIIVLLAAIAISAAISFNTPERLGYWISLLILTYFGVVLVIDLEHRLILHIVSLAGAGIGLIAGIMANGLLRTLIGGVSGFLIMWALYLLGILFARYRTRKMGRDDGEEALGFGDVTLSGVIGLMVGWPEVTRALFVAILVGGVSSVLMIIILVVTRRYQSMSVFTAYGPYLLIGAFLMIFFPQVAGIVMGK
jgi:leader peptidase (prepilin peptidase)/N-methyltransferase